MADLRDLSVLSGSGAGPCVSIYQPTHRHHPDNLQDPIRFRNLLDRVRASLARAPTNEGHDALLAPFEALAADAPFWNHATDALAVFGARGLFHVVRLQRPVPERAIVADSFHVKPLLRILQSADRFQLLALARDNVRLYEGNRDALDEVTLATGVPRKLEDSFGEDGAPEPQRQAHSYGTGPAAPGAGANRSPGGAKTGGIRHGHDSKKDLIDAQTERFFRAVDRAIDLHHSKPSGLPLMLAALPEYHAPFRAVSHNPRLIDAAIDIDPQSQTTDELRRRAWPVLEPRLANRLAEQVERFGAARAAGSGDDRLAPVAAAACKGRIDTLLIEAQRQLPGRLVAGVPHPAELAEPDVDDLLDDLAEQVLKTGGTVIVVDAERMPSTTGLAAIYRY